jgi:hypothetical protein
MLNVFAGIRQKIMMRQLDEDRTIVAKVEAAQPKL